MLRWEQLKQFHYDKWKLSIKEEGKRTKITVNQNRMENANRILKTLKAIFKYPNLPPPPPNCRKNLSPYFPAVKFFSFLSARYSLHTLLLAKAIKTWKQNLLKHRNKTQCSGRKHLGLSIFIWNYKYDKQ